MMIFLCIYFLNLKDKFTLRNLIGKISNKGGVVMPKDIILILDEFQLAISKMNSAINAVAVVDGNLKKANESLKGCWEGDSKDKYYTQYKKIADKFTDYKSCLQGMKDDLEIISQKFVEVDNELKNQINLEGNLDMEVK